jgi:multiple sugar transport system permease protein
MLPALTVICLVLVGPILCSIGLSFTNYSPTRNTLNFIGLVNYENLWESEEFRHAFRATVLFLFVVVMLEFVLGTLIALMLNRPFRCRNLVRTLFFLPFVITPVASGLQWRWLYSYQFGLLNYLLSTVGMEGKAWLTDLSTVWPAIIIAEVWRETPFVTILMLAGLQSLPQDLFESARIDGASRWQELWYVAFPLLRPIILVVLIMRSIFSFRVFDTIFVLTHGGPANFTQTIAFFGYRQGFEYWRVGSASAIAVFMLVFLAVLGTIYLRIMRQTDG